MILMIFFTEHKIRVIAKLPNFLKKTNHIIEVQKLFAP